MTYACMDFSSPVGTLKLVATPIGLAAVLWENDKPGRVPLSELEENPGHAILRQAETELREYFAGQRKEFSTPLDVKGTAFQQRVWSELRRIPFGETRSYSALSQQLGINNGARAVGAANGRNPVSIIVPCHRAIGADGSLTGFAGGLDAKRFLLALEREDSGETRASQSCPQQEFDL